MHVLQPHPSGGPILPGPRSIFLISWRSVPRISPARNLTKPSSHCQASSTRDSQGVKEGRQERLTLAAPRYQKILEVWDNEKNERLNPETVSHRADIFVHFKCSGCPDCGRRHEWTAKVKDLTRFDDRRPESLIGACPNCRGVKKICRCRSIAFNKKYPWLAAEYADENEEPAENVAVTSEKKKIWNCKNCGNIYEMKPSQRTLEFMGCSCLESPRLKAAHPRLAEEYDCVRNVTTLGFLKENSSKVVYWQCSVCGESWRAKVGDRALCKQGCPNPECKKGKGEASAEKEETFARSQPEEAEQSTESQSRATSQSQRFAGTLAHEQYGKLSSFWHPEKNGRRKPENVLDSSRQEIFLICQGCKRCGRKHERTLMAKDAKRVNWLAKGNCPQCVGHNHPVCFCRSIAADLTDKRIVDGWHPDNGSAEEYAQSSTRTAKWICSKCNEEYEAEARAVSRNSSFCPNCKSC